MHSPKPPLPKGGGLAKPNRGDKRLAGFHIGLYFLKVPTVNPSVTASPCQLPLAREPFCARYRFIVRYRALSDFQSTAWEGGSPKTNKPKRGQKLKRSTRAKAKGQSSDGFTRGILKGGIIRAGASYSPLEPASLLTFLPEQESKAPLASARSASGVNFAR